jgi:hypothetical protein
MGRWGDLGTRGFPLCSLVMTLVILCGKKKIQTTKAHKGLHKGHKVLFKFLNNININEADYL